MNSAGYPMAWSHETEHYQAPQDLSYRANNSHHFPYHPQQTPHPFYMPEVYPRIRLNTSRHASPEEIERRRVRRERNKVAAAKCRQRRVDHTNRLITETDKLEDERSSLESEIQTLQKQKDQLEFILQAHKPLCKADGIMEKSRIKPEFHSACGAETDHSSNGAAAFPNGITTIKQELPDYVDEYGSQCGMKPDHHSLHPCSRPSTLPLQAKPAPARSLAQVTLSSATGISITTPSSGFFSFDGFDGHSGLTPIGGPSCASQIHRNSADNSPDGVTSPTLISL